MTSGFDRLAGELRDAEQRRSATSRRPDRIRNLLLPMGTTAVVVAVLTVVLLNGAGTRHRPSPSGGPATASPDRGSFRLRCTESVGTQAPPKPMRVVLGAVALAGRPGESRALQTGRDGARLFAKSGLWVKSGATFTLTVAPATRGRLTMTWGDAGEGNHGVVMTDAGCVAGHAGWVNYVGGYWISHPLCATLVVTSGGRRRSVRIGIGTGCPGQRPPSPPTAS
jgi:hypothetical protein